MGLREELALNREAILQKWYESVLGDYHKDTAVFLRTSKDRFANPVGHTIKETLSAVLAHLLPGAPDSAIGVREALDAMVRIRAVQDFTPTEALGFMFRLKDVLQAHCPEGREAELIEIFADIDALVLEAFGIYMQCREKLCDLKVSELNNNAYRLLQDASALRAGGKGKG